VEKRVTIVLGFTFFYTEAKLQQAQNPGVSDRSTNLINTAKTTNYQGSPIGEAKLTKQVKAHFKKEHLSGTFEVVKNGNTVVRAANGYADTNYYCNVNSLYNIGSLQFQFNAAVLLKMAQNGKIDLNQKVKSIIPELKNMDNVTIRDIILNDNKIGLSNGVIKNNDYKQIIKKLKNVKVRKYISSQSIIKNNSILMAILIQKVENQDYSTVLRSQLLDMVPVLSYSLKKDIKQKPVNSLARSYRYQMKSSELQYDRPISSKTDVFLGINQISMSASDLYNSVQYLLKSNYLTANNRSLFLKGLLASNGTRKKNGYSISAEYNGFITNISMNISNGDGVIVLLNVNPGDITIQTVMRYLEKEYQVVE